MSFSAWGRLREPATWLPPVSSSEVAAIMPLRIHRIGAPVSRHADHRSRESQAEDSCSLIAGLLY